MIVKSLELDYFRNYVHLEAAFDPRVNLIYGDNAQGKTNLLEGIAYLSSARSHRARYDRELIQMNIDSAFLKGEVVSRNRDFTLEAKLFRGRGRQLFSNGVRLKTAGELAGILTTVLPSASCGPGMPRLWRSITGCTSIKPGFCGTGRRTPPCFKRWTISACAWPRRGPF